MKHSVLSMVHSLDAAETDSNDFPRKSEKAKEYDFLVVSQSGETKDVANVVNVAKEKDITREGYYRCQCRQCRWVTHCTYDKAGSLL